ncbi:hypothetical protein PS2_029417 [Malus domestica]
MSHPPCSASSFSSANTYPAMHKLKFRAQKDTPAQLPRRFFFTSKPQDIQQLSNLSYIILPFYIQQRWTRFGNQSSSSPYETPSSTPALGTPSSMFQQQHRKTLLFNF